MCVAVYIRVQVDKNARAINVIKNKQAAHQSKSPLFGCGSLVGDNFREEKNLYECVHISNGPCDSTGGVCIYVSAAASFCCRVRAIWPNEWRAAVP
jgi:hypothetical protein